jgi:hypothetical protein
MTENERALSETVLRQQGQITELRAELALLRPDRSPPAPPVVAWALLFMVLEQLRLDERRYKGVFVEKACQYRAHPRRRHSRLPELLFRAERLRCETNQWRRVLGMPELTASAELSPRPSLDKESA